MPLEMGQSEHSFLVDATSFDLDICTAGAVIFSTTVPEKEGGNWA
jgi:hypothetical protein